MLIASLTEPKSSTQGDYWYCLANKELYQLSITPSWMIIYHGYFDFPIPPNSGTHLCMPSIWIATMDPDRVPHVYSGTGAGWIPAVPPGYIFPQQSPIAGDCWRDSLSGFDFAYYGNCWHILSVGSNLGLPYNVSSGNVYATLPPILGPSIVLSANQSALKIGDLVEIFADGRIVYELGYTPDKAATALWEAIAQMSPIYKENEDTKKLKATNEYLEQVIQMYKDAGCTLPGPVRAPDPTAAWNAAMGVII